MADAARIAQRHGFVLKAVRHEGQLRIALVRPVGADATERRHPAGVVPPGEHPRPTAEAD
jgi:hypothetical protein